MRWWQAALGAMAGFVLVYLFLLGLLWRYSRTHPESVSMREAMRLLPDVLRLVKRLAADRSLPRTIRFRLLALLGYLAMPFDVVPDFIPVLGYADDALVVALVLRSVVRRAGPDTLDRHWPGTSQGLGLVKQLARVRASR
ncbi:YkvA family protein [Modestobacter sp. Leaf380]|uniref:YkvA family protein n=1 Tax=Modestobacter sp. Leaf380 TaxID=1736356 RepID=UPI000AAA4182|nr:YkvA family protein [Modestobacter sp. Leaf380]